MSETHPIIHVVLLENGEWWVAQGVNLDIAAQGRSRDLAAKAFLRTLVAQAQLDVNGGRPPFHGIPEAPEDVWDIFLNRSELVSKTPIELPQGAPACVVQAQAIAETHIN
jgi:hypothetical protein